MKISKEQETNYTFKVTVPGFGEPEKVKREQTLGVAAAIHHGLRGGCLVQDPDGNWWRYDPKGDDMGHHPGHDSALVPVDGERK